MKKFSLIFSITILFVVCGVLQCFSATKTKVEVLQIVSSDGNTLSEDFTIDNSALIRSVRRNKFDMVQKYLEKGADVNAKDDSGFFPLLIAVDNNNYDMVKLLISFGVDLNLKTGKIYDKKGIIDYGTALMYSTKLGLYEISKLLIVSGADVNAQNEDGKTALMIASERGNEKLTKLLISKGADVNIKNADKMTALSYAVRYDKIKTAKKLIAKGADVNNIHYYGKTPLIEATEKGNYEMVKLLVSNGADFNHKNNGYDTALDIARRDRNAEFNKRKPTKNLDKIVKLLEEKSNKD